MGKLPAVVLAIVLPSNGVAGLAVSAGPPPARVLGRHSNWRGQLPFCCPGQAQPEIRPDPSSRRGHLREIASGPSCSGDVPKWRANRETCST